MNYELKYYDVVELSGGQLGVVLPSPDDTSELCIRYITITEAKVEVGGWDILEKTDGGYAKGPLAQRPVVRVFNCDARITFGSVTGPEGSDRDIELMEVWPTNRSITIQGYRAKLSKDKRSVSFGCKTFTKNEVESLVTLLGSGAPVNVEICNYKVTLCEAQKILNLFDS